VNALLAALEDPAIAPARVRELLERELARGAEELQKPRSGYDEPVVVAFDAHGRAALPVPVAFRADPDVVGDRAWTVTAKVMAALQAAADLPPVSRTGDLRTSAADLGGWLVLGGFEADPELAVVAFDEAVATVDRLRASGAVVPAIEAVDPREPIGPTHPLKVAEVIARGGGDPAAPGDADDDLVAALLGQDGAASRPHDDPDPARRAARRILQRLAGMGKWGGYHTDFSHLARGFQGNERALADAVGEALIEAGLLQEKPSVGQRHVFLNPRRARDIHRLIDEGTVPVDLRLPRT
jgi:hypothetical protein